MSRAKYSKLLHYLCLILSKFYNTKIICDIVKSRILIKVHVLIEMCLLFWMKYKHWNIDTHNRNLSWHRSNLQRMLETRKKAKKHRDKKNNNENQKKNVNVIWHHIFRLENIIDSLKKHLKYVIIYIIINLKS